MILAIITAEYPRFGEGCDINAKTALWGEMFADEEYPVVSAALKMFIANDTKGFPPTVGMLKENIRLLTEPEMTEVEAWAVVRGCLNDSGRRYYENWQELPDVIKSVVAPSDLREWAYLPMEELNTVVASNFMRSYRVREKNYRQFEKIPKAVKMLVSSILEGKTLPGADPEILQLEGGDFNA